MKASERHKLKHDKAAETMMTGLGWARQHQSTIVAVFAAILVIIIGASWIIASRKQARESAAKELQEANTQAAQAFGLSGAERDEAIKSAVRRFTQIASDNSGSDVAAQALLAAGHILMQADMQAEALPKFEQALKASRSLPGISELARRNIAQALESLNKPEEAIKQYRELTKDAGDAQAAQAWWDIGRCFDKLKDREKAEEAYRTAVKLGGETEWAKLSIFRLEQLAAGGVLLGATTTTTVTSTTTTTTLAAAATPDQATDKATTTTTTVKAPEPAPEPEKTPEPEKP